MQQFQLPPGLHLPPSFTCLDDPPAIPHQIGRGTPPPPPRRNQELDSAAAAAVALPCQGFLYPPGIFARRSQAATSEEERKRRPGGLLPGNQSRGLLCPPGIYSRTHLAVYDQACYLGSLNGRSRTVFFCHFGSRELLFGEFGTLLPDFGTMLEGHIPYFGIPYSSRIKCKSNIH